MVNPENKIHLGMSPSSKGEWHITWQEIHNATRALAQTIKDANFNPTTIVAVAKGGIIPAGILLQFFPQAHFVVLRVESYDKKEQGEVLIHNPEVLTFVDFRRTLVVDDICDSGNTFQAIDNLFPSMRYAAIFRRSANPKQFHCYSGWLATEDSWLNFPWER
jgi:hypoxanthine phosphoribosyltransferase